VALQIFAPRMKGTENHDCICPPSLEQVCHSFWFFFRGCGISFLDGITVPAVTIAST
jgi:hypothetical protein